MVFEKCLYDKYGYPYDFYYIALEMIDHKEHLKLDKAEVIIDNEEDLPYFPKKFIYQNFYVRYIWVVQNFKGNHYCIIVRAHWRTGAERIDVTRYYMPGDKKRKKREVQKIPRKVIKTDIPSVGSSCQIYTLASLTNQPYSLILNQMREHGWRKERERINVNGKEVDIDTGNLYTKSLLEPSKSRWEAVLKQHGYEMKSVWKRSKFTGNKNLIFPEKYGRKDVGMTIKTAASLLPKNGKFAVSISGHVLAIINGEVYDNMQSSNCHVEEIFEINNK